MTVVCLALGAVPSRALSPQLVVTVAGKSTTSKTVGADTKIVATRMNNKALCGVMGVDPTKYTVVYDPNFAVLQLIPTSAGSMLPTKQILAGFVVRTYSATKPLSVLVYSTLSPAANAGGTAFDNISGEITVLLKQKLVNAMKETTGVLGSITGVANGAGATPAGNPLYNLTFSGAKPFVQKP